MVGHGIGTGSCCARLGRCFHCTLSDAHGAVASDSPSRSVGAGAGSPFSLASGAWRSSRVPVPSLTPLVTLDSLAHSAAFHD